MLRITENDAPAKVELKTKTYIDLFIRPNTTTEQKQTILNEWYRTELKKLVQPLIDKWQRQIGVTVDDWQVKQMKTKWGSCNVNANRIWLNLELAKKSPECLEYILVHELVHLLERKHNEHFQAHMDKFMPNWIERRDLLNNFS